MPSFLSCCATEPEQRETTSKGTQDTWCACGGGRCSSSISARGAHGRAQSGNRGRGTHGHGGEARERPGTASSSRVYAPSHGGWSGSGRDLGQMDDALIVEDLPDLGADTRRGALEGGRAQAHGTGQCCPPWWVPRACAPRHSRAAKGTGSMPVCRALCRGRAAYTRPPRLPTPTPRVQGTEGHRARARAPALHKGACEARPRRAHRPAPGWQLGTSRTHTVSHIPCPCRQHLPYPALRAHQARPPPPGACTRARPRAGPSPDAGSGAAPPDRGSGQLHCQTTTSSWATSGRRPSSGRAPWEPRPAKKKSVPRSCTLVSTNS